MVLLWYGVMHTTATTTDDKACHTEDSINEVYAQSEQSSKQTVDD